MTIEAVLIAYGVGALCGALAAFMVLCPQIQIWQGRAHRYSALIREQMDMIDVLSTEIARSDRVAEQFSVAVQEIAAQIRGKPQ